MKNLWIFILIISLEFSAQATALDDKMKSFSDALQASDASNPTSNHPMGERGAALAVQLRTSLGMPGNEANLEAQVRQIMAAISSDKVQAAGNALLAELDAQRKERSDALAAKINAILDRLPDILVKAQKTPDLDEILEGLQKVEPSQGGVYGYDQETQTQMSRVNSAYQYVSQWQDYLSARNSGNTSEAQNILRNLLNSRPMGDGSFVPRSEILALITSLTGPVKFVGSGISSPAPSPSENIASILNEIKTLDDMDVALKKIRVVPNANYDTGSLQQLVNIYANAKNGLTITLDVTPMSNSNAGVLPEFGRIRTMVIMYLVPLYIGNDALTPNPNETVTDYLKRSVEASEAKQDWTSLQRIVGAEIKIAGGNGYPMGTRCFVTGLNQEMAGQYSLAVVSYQTALENPDDYLPAKVVGDRLAAIKKDHAAEYDEGMKEFLNPPVPAYMNPYIQRSGVSYGYLVPGNPASGIFPTGSPTSTNAAAMTPSSPVPPSATTNAAPVAPAPPTK